MEEINEFAKEIESKLDQKLKRMREKIKKEE